MKYFTFITGRAFFRQITWAVAALLFVPAIVRAEPNREKAFLSSATSLQNAWAVAQVPSSRWLIALFRGSPGAVHLFDTYEWKKSASGEIVGTSTDFNDPVAVVVSGTRAYVANYGNNSVTVLRFDTETGKPAVLTKLTGGASGKFGTTSTPRPVGLFEEENTLWVLNYEGTVSKINTTGDLNVRVGFTAGNRTAQNDVLVCGNTTTPASSKFPVSIARQGNYTYVGCEGGTITRLENNGTTVNRTIIAGGGGRGRILLPHPKEADVLFYIDDKGRQVAGIDTADSVFDSGSSPLISPLCRVSGVNVDVIPLTASPSVAMAGVAFEDTGSNEDAWLAILNNRSGAAGVQMINVDLIDTSNSTTPPDCTPLISTIEAPVASGKNIDYSITGSGGSSPTAAPAGVPMQMSFDMGFLFVPNYGAAAGTNVVSVFTNNPYFSSGTAAPAALSGITTDPDETAVQSAEVRVISEESTVSVRGSARIDDTLPFENLSAGSSVTGTNAGFTVSLNELVLGGIVVPGTSEIVQVLVEARDSGGNYGRRIVPLPVDSVRPLQPAITSIGAGDRRLEISLIPGSDLPDPETGVSSGIGGYRVVFLQVHEELDDGSTIDLFAADYPEPGDLERKVVTDSGGGEVITPATVPNEFIPVPRSISVEGASTTVVSLDGLRNLVTYTFDIYSLDKAGNRSLTGVRGEGEPDAGVGLFDILGEKGCTMSPQGRGSARDFLGFAMLLSGWLLVFSLRRRIRP